MKNKRLLLFVFVLPHLILAQVILPSSNSGYNKLVWSDEFDEEGTLDSTKWHHQTQLPNGNSWYNGELQHYTDRIENSYMQGGMLYIMAKRELFTDQGHSKNFTSARLNSKFAFTYGRVEVRAKLPRGVGTWPAIWMLGKNINETGGYWQPQFGSIGWPACGEIDIMEHWGNNQNFVQSALHTPSSHGATVNKSGFTDTTVSDSFHVYALEWSPEKMEFSFDGKVFYTYNPGVKNADTWPFTADQYILLNVAIQGPVEAAFSQDALVIDYVRVFQEGSTDVEEDGQGMNWKVYPNPVRDEIRISLPERKGEVELRVFGAAGRLLDHQMLENRQHKLDWSTYPDGMYTILLQSAEKQRFFRLVK